MSAAGGAAGPSRLVRAARVALPFAVSAGALALALAGVDLRDVVAHWTPDVVLRLGAALAPFLIVSLVLEAQSLVLVVSQRHAFRDLFVAARIKAASWPLGLVHYALGAGATVLLLRRRAGTTLAEATGAVLLISLFDLAALVVLALAGAGLRGAASPGLQAGVVALTAASIAAGFAVLRAPARLGPLDRLRELAVLRDARTLPLAVLARLAALRLGFVAAFVALVAAALAAFGVRVPPLDLVVDTSVLLLVSALPIAVAGLGTGQLVFVALFERFAPRELLLAVSLTLSFGLIAARAAVGLVFAREFTREALAAREADPA